MTVISPMFGVVILSLIAWPPALRTAFEHAPCELTRMSTCDSRTYIVVSSKGIRLYGFNFWLVHEFNPKLFRIFLGSIAQLRRLNLN